MASHFIADIQNHPGFKDIFSFLVYIGLAKCEPIFGPQCDPQNKLIQEEQRSLVPMSQRITLQCPLLTPFPQTPQEIGTFVRTSSSSPLQSAAEKTLSTLLANLVQNPLSSADRVRFLPILSVVKTCNIFKLVCSTHTLCFLARGDRGNRMYSTWDTTRCGKSGFEEFVSNNPDIVSMDSESVEHAFALNHVLDPGVVSAMRCGIISTTILFTPLGLKKVREGDPSIRAFRNDDELISALKHARSICILSYRHVMHSNNFTGLCQEQLDSVSEELSRYDYVWIDTVFSRASKQKWNPGCVMLFGILDCVTTNVAENQRYRTWIKTENILKNAKRNFIETRYNGSVIHTGRYHDIQMQAAKQISEGGLNGTESTFPIDKDNLEEWAANAYTFPSAELSGVLQFMKGNLSNVAAENHFTWSVLRSPYSPDAIVEIKTPVSPEMVILHSINVDALKCDRTYFRIALLTQMQRSGHCVYIENWRTMYALFGDVGNFGCRMFIYRNLEVECRGDWIHVLSASKQLEFGLGNAESGLIATSMAMNSTNEFDMLYLPTEPGHEEEALLKGNIPASSYEYKCRYIDVSGIMERENSPFPFSSCRPQVRDLVRALSLGVQYRKLATVYFQLNRKAS